MKSILVFVLVIISPVFAFAAGFETCFDHGNDGKEPLNAPRIYKILKPTKDFPHPSLKAVKKAPTKKTFKLITEDVRFTSYKCWDKKGNLTGHDVEMMTEAAYKVGYKYIEFVLRPWSDAEVNGKKVPSLLSDLIEGQGDAVSAGMSMTEDRESTVRMIGPIYKAGKKLMARKDNPKITPDRLQSMLNLPSEDYQALRGLSIIVQASTIRADFFKEMAKAHPDLIEYVGSNPASNENQKLLVLETDSATIENFVDLHMTGEIQGRLFDLVMLDTGSTQSLIDEGKLGQDTQIVSGNLGADPRFGFVFGKGDGVSFRKESPLIQPFKSVLTKMVRSGRINQMVEKWFNDENAANHSWATQD